MEKQKIDCGVFRGIHPRTWDYLLAAYPGVYGHYYGYHYFYVSNTKGLATGGYSGSGAGGGFSSAGGGARALVVAEAEAHVNPNKNPY